MLYGHACPTKMLRYAASGRVLVRLITGGFLKWAALERKKSAGTYCALSRNIYARPACVFVLTDSRDVCYIIACQFTPSDMPKWRNWQTQWTQNPPLATACRFKSGLRHHEKIKLRYFCSRAFLYGQSMSSMNLAARSLRSCSR